MTTAQQRLYAHILGSAELAAGARLGLPPTGGGGAAAALPLSRASSLPPACAASPSLTGSLQLAQLLQQAGARLPGAGGRPIERLSQVEDEVGLRCPCIPLCHCSWGTCSWQAAACASAVARAEGGKHFCPCWPGPAPRAAGRRAGRAGEGRGQKEAQPACQSCARLAPGRRPARW